jgi:hypothetical protein
MSTVPCHFLNAIYSKEEFLDIEDDIDNIEFFEDGDSPHDKLCSEAASNDDLNLEDVKVEGSAQFLDKAKSLLRRHTKRFSKVLTNEAARLKPFDLDLNPSSTWYQNKQNKLPSRRQSRNKQLATSKFVENAIAAGLV